MYITYAANAVSIICLSFSSADCCILARDNKADWNIYTAYIAMAGYTRNEAIHDHIDHSVYAPLRSNAMRMDIGSGNTKDRIIRVQSVSLLHFESSNDGPENVMIIRLLLNSKRSEIGRINTA